jgi:hypothetical protein
MFLTNDSKGTEEYKRKQSETRKKEKERRML